MTVSNPAENSPNSSPQGVFNPRAGGTEAASGSYQLHKLTLDDLTDSLRRGFDDWRACRTDVLVMVIIYPLAALLLAGMIVDQALFPFLFPICAGFALIGPLATLWFTALSRERERSGYATSDAAAAVFDSPRIVPIQRLALGLILLFAAWVAVAGIIYAATLASSDENAGAGFFVRVFTTGAGHEMILIGCLAGAVFAFAALAFGLISFSMALDRDVSTFEAARASARAALLSPGICLVWGGMIVAGFIIGAIPALLGLAVVLPILGHANWHIYRRAVS